MLLACSGHYGELDPPPDITAWQAEADATQRLRRGLTELYAFYERVEEMLTRVVRDAEFHGPRENRPGVGRPDRSDSSREGLPGDPDARMLELARLRSGSAARGDGPPKAADRGPAILAQVRAGCDRDARRDRRRSPPGYPTLVDRPVHESTPRSRSSAQAARSLA